MRVSALLLAAGLAACGGGDSTSTNASPQRMRTAAAAIAAPDYGTEVQQLYVAYFGRPADPYGLIHFKAKLSQMNAPETIPAMEAVYPNNGQLRELVNSFATSVESQAFYTGTTDEFITAIYKNVLARTPPQGDEGKAYWVRAIDVWGMSRSRAAMSIVAGAQRNTSDQGKIDAQVIQSKTSVAAAFSAAVTPEIYNGDAAAALARKLLNTVDKPDITGESFQPAIAAVVEQLQERNFYSLFPGNYSGTFSGGESGTFTFSIAEDGTISGSGKTDNQNTTLVISGNLAKANGESLPITAALGPFTFTGTLTATGKLTGTWSGFTLSGPVTAKRVSP